MAIEATLWDIGGVLTSSPFEAFNRFEAAHDLPTDFIRSVNSTNPRTNAWARFEASHVSADEFDALFRAESTALGHPVSGKAVLELLSGEIRPRMIAALARCREHFKVGAITNNVKPDPSRPAPRDPDRASVMEVAMAHFDLVVESSVEGIRKPDPAIYRLACERLEVEPARCVFLDDLGINLKPARAMGMHTIKVVDEDQALAELAEATGLEFDT
ncbi:MAG: HAD-IA family hydrolase [Gammaproteobacteria bacterium]|nr:HAD-IA family hydrolase [Gammaproteobacteria bacterium]